jgi:hypothetical protein
MGVASTLMLRCKPLRDAGHGTLGGAADHRERRLVYLRMNLCFLATQDEETA